MEDEPRYTMSPYHPEYFNRGGRKWCFIVVVMYSSDGNCSQVEVLWHDENDFSLGYEVIPIEWLAHVSSLGEEQPQTGTCVSIW